MKLEEQIEERRQIREQDHEKYMQTMFMQFMQQIVQNHRSYSGFPQYLIVMATSYALLVIY